MSIITLEFDNTLEKSSIIVPLVSSSKGEGGEGYSDSGQTDKAQTAVFGIQTPLIQINSTVIDFDAVKQFSLKSKGRMPELSMTVEDRYEIITNIDKPGNDNEVRVQILPRFDNAYKKIDLTFYITNINVSGSMIRLTCAYKVPALLSSKFKTYGEIDTYTLFKNAAQETALGFATNVAECNDKRFMYCDNVSIKDLLDREIQYSTTDVGILDWWVDFWDNINLADIKERYNAIDSDDDMQIWIAGNTSEVNADNEVTAQKVTATVNTLPGTGQSELFVSSYRINNRPGAQISMGSDKVYCIYEDAKSEHFDYLMQDGDIHSDIFTKYSYIGENYGEYNYMLSKCIREGFIQKMTTDTIVITLTSPLLGLMRGHKVNFVRYVNDDKVENKLASLEKAGVIDRNVESNIPLAQYETQDETGSGNFRVDKSASGQYLILDVNATYSNGKWEYILTLARPKPAQSMLPTQS